MKIIISFLIFFCIGFQTANSDAIIGQWENPDGTRRIEIFKGEKAYLGKVVWLKVKEPKAKPGDIVLDDFQFQDSYWNGKITLPGESHIFNAELRLQSRDRLEIKVFYHNMSRKKVWKRIP